MIWKPFVRGVIIVGLSPLFSLAVLGAVASVYAGDWVPTTRSVKLTYQPHSLTPKLTCAPGLLKVAQEAGLGLFLNRFPVIRVGVAAGPGFGHQMCSVHLARRLRELGFRNEIQIIYDEGTAPKLEVLVKGFNAAEPGVQKVVDFENSLTLVSQSVFEQTPNRFPPVALGFLGAEDDRKMFSSKGRTLPVYYRVDTLVRLQPPNWLEGTMSIENTAGRLESLEDLKPLRNTVTRLDPKDLDAFLKAELKDPAGSARFENLKKLLSPSSPWLLAPFYNAHTDRVYTVGRYAEGIALAMDESPNHFPNGVVIPILSEMSDYNLHNLGLSLKKRTRTASIAKLEARDFHFTPPAAGQIQLLPLEGLPPRVAQLFFERTELPPAISGKYSRNLMLELGLPFLEIAFTDLEDDLPMPKPISQLMNLAICDFTFDRDNPTNPSELPPRAIAKIILLARSAEGDVLRSTFAGDPKRDPLLHDKATQAIQRLRKFLESP